MQIRNLSQKSRSIREGIVNFFRERDCITMVMPCMNEKDIRKLETLPKTAIRPEFNSQVNKIRNKIFTQCGPKKLNGSYLNSRMYLKMVQEYVKAISSGSMPMIQNAWQNVLENECAVALDSSRKVYDTAYSEKFDSRKKIYRKQELVKVLKEIRDQAYTAFNMINSVKEGDEELFDRYFQEIVKYIERREKIVIEQNANLSEE